MTSFLCSWSTTRFPPKGSIILAILPNVLILGGLGLVVSLLFKQGIPLSFSMPGHIFELMLGLLLIFRVNAAYHRFLAGQRCWGILVNTIRNLSTQIWLAVEDKESKDRQRKAEAVHWLAAFAITTKLYLRHQSLPIDGATPPRQEYLPKTADLHLLLPTEQYQLLSKVSNPPLEIAFWFADYLQLQYQRERLNLSQLTAMRAHLDTLVAVLGDCDRIVASSFSSTYVIYLRQMMLLYCITLPFQIVALAGWATAPIVMLIGAIVLGSEAIGRVLEHPFHPRFNTLPLDEHCQMLVEEIRVLVARPPRSPNQTSIKMTMVSE